jgi:hypothetical protein
MRRMLMLLLCAAAALAVPAVASAHGGHHGDRNRDGLPDRWERQHHLSMKVNQAHRDPDRDRLDNRNEFEHGTDPNKADTDDNGVEDRDEVEPVGTIASFTNGTLTITLANGQSVSGQVTPGTEIECEAMAKAAHDGSGDDHSGPGSGEDENENEVENENAPPPAMTPPAPTPPAPEGEQGSCGQDALKAGTPVREAEAKLTASGLVFEKIELGTA